VHFVLLHQLDFLLQGIIWPSEAIPSLIGWISNAFPHKHLAESLRSSILRKISFTKFRVS
jgi:ABC-type polysaccharide/polyol phosphate export permease